MKKMRKNKFSVVSMVALAALLVVGMVAGTFAWFNQTASVENKLKTGNYDTTVEENFPDPGKLVPGTEATKEAWVNNKGEVPVVVRVAASEVWVGEDGSILPNTFKPEGGEEQDVVIKTWGDTLGTKWVKSGEYYYFMDMLMPGEKTPHLLEKIMLNPNINAIDEKTVTTTTGEDGKIITTTTVKNMYNNADYSLTFTVETVQASQDAVNATWAATIDSVPAELMNKIPATAADLSAMIQNPAE